MGDIATRLGLPPGGITPIVERLEAADHVVRRRDEGDRRIVHVMLTAAGAKLETAASKAQRRVVCATMLSEVEFSNLRSMLHNLNDRLTCSAANGLP